MEHLGLTECLAGLADVPCPVYLRLMEARCLPGLAWPGLLSFFLSLCVFLGEDGEKGEGGMKGMDYGHTRTVAFDKSHFGKPA